MLKFEFDPFETILRVPLAAPELVGVNVAENVTLWLGLNVVGKLNPLIKNPEPETFA